MLSVHILKIVAAAAQQGFAV